jgi:hypothetical protein
MPEVRGDDSLKRVARADGAARLTYRESGGARRGKAVASSEAALLRSRAMGARICPGCGTRVDERRAKTSPYCLRCGAPLGPPAPSDGGRSSTFASKQPGAGGGSALPWILGGIGVVVLLGLGGVVALIAVVSSNADPEPPVATVATPPKVEAPPTATAITAGSAPSTGPGVRAPVPTVRTTATSRPPTPPVPTPPPFPTAPPTATGTGTGTGTGTSSGGVAVLAPFNRSKAQSEVDRVGATLASCSRNAGPFGAGTIRVDFEPDGRVGTLSRPPFAGTAAGSCISSRFLAIRIGPFSGSTQSIEKSFIIQQ